MSIGEDAERQRAAAVLAGEFARRAAAGAREIHDVDDSKPVALALASIALSLGVLADQATAGPIPGIAVFNQSS
ncbi:hypothetical protein [Parafrankia discariae]|uniref:hypothetical protein n=1 Tax=Parafrankia discariae TaxID=365528 RepID=UPI0003689A22|nr:hypothetical protein [Parafrankia discariae]